jgi:hypothetical protein
MKLTWQPVQTSKTVVQFHLHLTKHLTYFLLLLGNLLAQKTKLWHKRFIILIYKRRKHLQYLYDKFPKYFQVINVLRKQRRKLKISIAACKIWKYLTYRTKAKGRFYTWF